MAFHGAAWTGAGVLLAGTAAGIYGFWTLTKQHVIEFLVFCCFKLANTGLGLLIGDQLGEMNDFALWEEEIQHG